MTAKQKAKRELNKSLPHLLALMRNKTFVARMVKSGYQFDSEQVLKTILDSSIFRLPEEVVTRS